MNVIILSKKEIKELKQYTIHDLIKMMKGELLVKKDK
jgi:hypothetical protein